MPSMRLVMFFAPKSSFKRGDPAQMKQLGYFSEEGKAAKAYDEAVSLYRPGAEVNFPMAYPADGRGDAGDEHADCSEQPVTHGSSATPYCRRVWQVL